MAPNPIIDDLSNKPLQASNDCFVRFFRFHRRDTRDHINRKPAFVPKDEGVSGGIRHGERLLLGNKITESSFIDVASDVLACTVSKAKASPSGSFEIVLSSADINYHHVLHPGDHAMIWMRRRRVQNIQKNVLISKTFNNDFDSGLKMYGIITSVRRSFKTLADGRKILRYKVTGKDVGFFFESQVYYTAWLSAVLGKYGIVATVFDSDKVLSQNGFSLEKWQRVHDILEILMTIYLGDGPPSILKELPASVMKGAAARPLSPNDKFVLPDGVGQVFPKYKGVPSQTVADLLRRRLGVEDYSMGFCEPVRLPMEGQKILTIEAGNQQSVWNIMKAYSNPAINEMFIDLKPTLTSAKGEVYALYPTLVCRQIPFTSSTAKTAYAQMAKGLTTDNEVTLASTAFVELPRLKIPEKFILDEDMGRGDHERYNFLEIYGIVPGVAFSDPTIQQQFGNFCIDSASVKRYGLNTLIANTDFCLPAVGDKVDPGSIFLISKWIYLLTDWWLGAHTYESGTFQLVGIEEPLSLGDNIEIIREKTGINELYHVEAYQHTYSIDPSSGIGLFRTTVQVSRGQRVDEYPIYASGQFDEENTLSIGLSDTEFENTARPTNQTTSKEIATDPKESPEDRTKRNK